METRPPAKKAWTTTACVSALAIAAKALRNSLGPPIIVGSNWRPASAHSLPGRFLGQIYPLRYFANLLILLTTPAGFGTASLAAATEFSFVISTDVRSARRSATTAASRIVACIGLETVRAVRSAIDADYRQDDDGCGLGVGVDIFPPRAPISSGNRMTSPIASYPLPSGCLPPRGCRLGAFPQLKDLQG